jgi:5-hydroxyisourate hydrolase-like protein (transthyretin family)
VLPTDLLSGRELLAALEEELGKLPPRYRDPLVLCYLDGLTRDEVATRLGTSAGAVKIRLERGRKRLGSALTARGCGLGAGLLALAVASPVRASPRLVQAILASVSGPPPAAVAALAKGAIVNTLVNRSLSAAFVLVAAVLGIGWGASRLAATAATAPPAATAPAKAAAGKEKAVKPAPAAKWATVAGRVLSPAGKPLAGAEVLLVGKKKPQKLAVTGTDGRFTVRAPRGERWVYLLAQAPGVGVDFIDLGLAPPGDIKLRTVPDHPIRGRVIDTEGKPVRGVTVAVEHVGVYGKDSLDPFLAAWKNRQAHDGLPGGVKHVWDRQAFPPTTTDRDGRFTVTGVGRERLVSLRLRGAGIAESELWVVNRTGFDPRPYNKATTDSMARSPFGAGLQWLLYGPDLSFVAEAEKPIRGLVKDRDTGEPRAGVKVTLSRNGNELVALPVSATTDAKGRYQIRGARKAKAYMVEVSSDPASGHMACQARAADTPGYGPITIDLTVKQGVIVTGQVLDGATRKPLPGFVMVSVLSGNSFAKQYPDFSSSAFFYSEKTADDGTFRVVTIPGPVIVMGGPDPRRHPDGDLGWYRYKPVAPDPKYPKYFPKTGGFFFGLGGSSLLQGCSCKVVVIKPGTRVVRQDIVLEPTSALPVKVLDAAGRPVAGTWVAGISPEEWHRPTRIAGATCPAYHLQPGKPRLLVFYEPGRKLFGILRLKGDEKTPAQVKLGPGGVVTGRVVGEDGRPLAGVAVRLYHRERQAEEVHAHVHRSSPIETDADGKFRIEEVVPGVKLGLWFSRARRDYEPVKKGEDRAAEPGKTLELGDVKVKVRPRAGE